MADEENPKDKTEKEEDEKPKKDKKEKEEDHEHASKDDRRMAQLVYMVFFSIAALVALIIKFWGTDHLDELRGGQFGSCNGVAACIGNQAVYRLSWASFVFFMLMCIFTICVIQVHYKFYLCKFLVLVASCIGFFFLPDSFMDVWSEICRVLSFFFLVLQLIILIDFANDLHEFLINPQGQDGDDAAMPCSAKATYLTLCFLGIGGSIAGCVCMFIYLGDCPLNKFFIAMTLIFGFLTVLLSSWGKFNKGLLVPSIIFAYGTFICWQAISSNPNTDCNANAAGTGSQNLGSLIIGLIIIMVSLVYACNSAANAAPTLCTFGVAKKEDDPDQKNYFFHFVMAMGCMYMAMILTNWGKSSGDASSNTNTGISTESMWIKISSQWFAYVLYVWSLLAPVLFPDRDFSTPSNRFRDN